MRVGVVGLGAMGSAVARNLIGAGYATTVWNRSPGPVREIVAYGAVGAAAVGEALRCDLMLSVLLDDAAV